MSERGLSEEELAAIDSRFAESVQPEFADGSITHAECFKSDMALEPKDVRALIAEVRRLRDAKVTVSRGDDGSLTLTNVGDVPITFRPDERETVGWPGYGALRFNVATGWVERQRPDDTWTPYYFVTLPTPSADQAREP